MCEVPQVAGATVAGTSVRLRGACDAQPPPGTIELTLPASEWKQLTVYARSRALLHGLVWRAHLFLVSAQQLPPAVVARRLGLSIASVTFWGTRSRDRGLAGVYDVPRSGRPRRNDDEPLGQLPRTVLESPPPAGRGHCAVRTAAQASRLSTSTLQSHFQFLSVQPHRAKSYKLSTRPFFVKKVRHVVGPYLNPPDFERAGTFSDPNGGSHSSRYYAECTCRRSPLERAGCSVLERAEHWPS